MDTLEVSNRFTPEGHKKTVFVDIDETIAHYPGGIRRYDLAEPKRDEETGRLNLEKINDLYDSGEWYVIYWTARGSVSGHYYYGFTWKQLEDWGCRFHDLICGKQKGHFDLLIDDKAITIEQLYVDKETGEVVKI
jgi:hypothetical protein